MKAVSSIELGMDTLTHKPFEELSDDEKKPYEEKSKAAREEYAQSMKEWRERHPNTKTRGEMRREKKQQRKETKEAKESQNEEGSTTPRKSRKRTVSGYMVYCSQNRQRVKEANPGSGGEVR